MEISFTDKSNEFKRIHIEEMQKIKNEFMEAIKIMEMKNNALANKYNESFISNKKLKLI